MYITWEQLGRFDFFCMKLLFVTAKLALLMSSL